MGPSPPLLGLVLAGRYRITDHIGEGAMASVFAGQDLEAGGVRIAVKVMHPHLANDRTFSARFKREAQAASMVKHPNSVAIQAVGEENGIHFIIMELCPGKDLRETLKLERRLSELRAVKILQCVAATLRVAHELGVIHRDLKPENVMIQNDPQTGVDLVKVLDFGIAKLVAPMPKLRASPTDSDPAPAITQFGVVVGTPQYMSPEQVRGHALDGRSDLYTCGILLYQMVTGVLPFDGESPLEVAGRHAFEAPKPPSQFLPSIDQVLEQIILRLLSKQPEDRPQSAAALIDVLQLWERGKSNQGPVRGVGQTTPLHGGSGPFVASAVAPIAATPPRGQLGTLMELDAPAAAGQRAASNPWDVAPSFGTPAQGSASLSGELVAPAQPLPLRPGQGPAPMPAGSAATNPQAAAANSPPTRSPSKRSFGILGLVLLLLSAGVGVGVGVGLHLYCGGALTTNGQSESAEPPGPPPGVPFCQ
jgi:serine/threonine-protein kinase